MRFYIGNSPKSSDKKEVKKFAWYPLYVSESEDETEYVWWEWYIQKYTYSKGYMHGTDGEWLKSGKIFKNKDR